MHTENTPPTETLSTPLRRRLWIPVLLCIAYLAQCAWFIGTQSLTFDEPHDIKAGQDAWREGSFVLDDSHTAPPRMWSTLPVLAGEWRVDQVEENPATGIHPDPVAMAWRVRAMQSLLGLALALLLWSTARRLFSEGAANFSLALFAFSPPLIAHFSLATSDAAGVLMTFAGAVQLLRWRQQPTRAQTILLGLVLGGMLLAKYYAPPLFLLALGWMLIAAPDKIHWNPRHWNWAAAAAVVVISCGMIWASYFFHVTHITLRDGTVELTVPGHAQPLIAKMPTPIAATFSLPAVEYLTGLGSAVDHNHRGHKSYFLGELSKTGGWKLYFPVVVLLKWSTVVLLLLAFGLWLVLRGRFPWPKGFLLLASFPVVFLVSAIFSSINIGDRHVLPVFPFLLLFLAGLWDAARGRRALRLVLLVALLLHAGDALRVAPDYLSWFNIFVKPAESWRLLADSGVDWGQGLLAVKQYEAEHPEEKTYLAYFGNVDPRVYGIRAIPLAQGQRVSGTVIVSSTYLSGLLLEDPDAYKWLLQYRRKSLLDHSLHVFEVPAQPNPSPTPH